MLEVSLVRTITKRLVGRQAAAADRNNSAALQAVLVALCVYNFKIAVNFNGAVAVYSKFSFFHVRMFCGEGNERLCVRLKQMLI